MSSTTSSPSENPQPAWEIARLFPPQGCWSEGSYLSFTESLNQLVELVDGHIEVLEMPTKSHQKIVHYLLNLFLACLASHKAGDAVSAPYRVRIREGTYREPDIAVYLTEHLDRFGERHGDGADLVVEVVSEDAASRARDYEDKRREYATAGIREYWIVDPLKQRITVLALQGNDYVVHGEFGASDDANSVLLADFSANVAAVLRTGQASSDRN